VADEGLVSSLRLFGKPKQVDHQQSPAVARLCDDLWNLVAALWGRNVADPTLLSRVSAKASPINADKNYWTQFHGKHVAWRMRRWEITHGKEIAKDNVQAASPTSTMSLQTRPTTIPCLGGDVVDNSGNFFR